MLLAGLVSGELRQGAQLGVLTDAVAKAAGLPLADVRTALMLTGSLPVVAVTALTDGAAGLAAFRLQVGQPLSVRSLALARAVPERWRAPRAAGDVEAFAADALARGHEGVVVKDPAAPYDAGRRGGAWLKVKPVHTFDLVVLAAEWGHGRRRGRLSNLHLGARDGEGFVMLGKTFKGLTDELLAWQTEQLLARSVEQDQWRVVVRPELVVETAIDGVQTFPRYPGGIALRFTRVLRYRPDKTPDQADTLDALRRLHVTG